MVFDWRFRFSVWACESTTCSWNLISPRTRPTSQVGSRDSLDSPNTATRMSRQEDRTCGASLGSTACVFAIFSAARPKRVSGKIILDNFGETPICTTWRCDSVVRVTSDLGDEPSSTNACVNQRNMSVDHLGSLLTQFCGVDLCAVVTPQCEKGTEF